MKVALALLACIGIAACGGSTPQPPKNATPEAVRETAAPALVPSAGDVPAGDPSASNALRILVARSRTYFVAANDRVRGRAVDIGVALGQALKRPVRFIDTPEDALIPDLLAGKGDVAANLLLTFSRDDQVAFATPFQRGIRELVVTGPKEKPLISLEDIGGRTIHVRAKSDHPASLVRLNEQLKGINRPPARIALTNGTDEDLLEQVNAGKIPATLADDYILDAWKQAFPNVHANRDIAVSQDGVLAWVTRKDNAALLQALNDFFSTHRVTIP